MSDTLGVDVDGVSAPKTAGFPWATSRRLSLAQRIARSLMQPANSLPYWPGYGYDLKAACGSLMRPADIARGVQQQAERFEGVERAIVTVTRNTDGSLSVRCDIEDSDGPFDLVMSASEAAVKLVSLWGEKVING